MNRLQASVLLPVRGGTYLDEALRSLGAQTFEPFEICLQLDGADEVARRVAKEASRADARVRVEARPGRGIVEALNAAAARARSDLYVRMDADDLCTPDRLERLVTLADQHPDVGFFASRTAYVSDAPLSDGLLRYQAWLDRVVRHEDIVANRFVECPMPHPAWAVRRSVFEALEGYRDGSFPEDYELFLRAVDAGVRFEKAQEVLLHWRDSETRLSRRDPRYSLGAFFDLKVRFLVPVLERDGREVVLAGQGKAARRWRKALSDAGVGEAMLAPTDALPAGRDQVVLIAVGGEEREQCARALGARGLVEGVDFYGVQ